MPLFLVTCTDKPNALDTRTANRPAHVEYLKSLGGAVRVGGPFLSETDSPLGSILLLEAADRAAIDKILADDPYTKAGLFANVDVKRFRWAINPPADLA